MTDEVSSPPRRILSVWLPRLAIDRWRLGEGCARGEGPDADPLALIAETAHGPRIDAVNDAGRAAGARRGMMLADARTLCPRLKVASSDPEGDLAFLGKLAVWAQRWGPWSALDAPGGLVIDVTAVAHLFGGETRLLADAQATFARRRLTARLAIAPTAGAAWALSHFGPERAILQPGDDAAACLEELPVAALRLDDEVLVVLAKGKVWTGLLGMGVPPLLVIGALRLSRPHAPWARWRYLDHPHKMDRALQRERRIRRPLVRANLWLQSALAGMPRVPDDTAVDATLDRQVHPAPAPISAATG